MNLRLYDKEQNHVFLEKEYPECFVADVTMIRENITRLEHRLGTAVYREIYFEGVHIGYGHAELKEKVLLDFESDFETIEMHFALKGESVAYTQSLDQGVGFSANRHNIIYANGLCGKVQWQRDTFQLCEINLSPAFFKKFLPGDSRLFDTFRNMIEKGRSGLLNRQHHCISHQMYQVLTEIMTCRREGVFKRMFMEAKVIELLLLQFEQFSGDHEVAVSIKKSDVDKIYAVRSFILENLNAPCSLIDLAHLAGTNEFILKKGFKELFGTTVFAFWNDAKMDHARKLLSEEEMNIGEVAYTIGYKNPRHFSTAFKRKFGVLPSRLGKHTPL